MQVVGNLIESEGPFCSIGESCEITSAIGKKYSGEVIGFRGSTMLSMAVENPQGIRFGDRIVAWGTRSSIRVGSDLLGRVIDATGAPTRFQRRISGTTVGVGRWVGAATP